MILCWILISTHKHHIISIQYPSHKCLPEKSYLDCLRILFMSWLFKDSVVIMKEIMSWLFKDPIATVAWFNLNHIQSNSKKWPKKIKLPQINFFYQTNFFWYKLLLFLSSSYWSFTLHKILKKFLQWILSYEGAPLFLGPKWTSFPTQNLFWKKLKSFSSTY